jgi:CheY-like chemotaxis protein
MTTSTVDILLVEDSRTQAELIGHALTESGYRVRPALTGLQALDLVRESAPAIVVSDILMPGIDGYALCRTLKSEPATRDIPFILLTTLTEPADIVRGIECGADSFLCKPFSAEALLALLDRWRRHGALDRSQMFDLLLSSLETLRKRNEELERALRDAERNRPAPRHRDDAVRICAKCKKVQDDRGDWVPVEEFLRRTAGLAFTHEFCGDCGAGLMRAPGRS